MITQKDDNNTMQAELIITQKDSEESLLDAVVTKEKKDYTYDGLCFGIIAPYLPKICRDMFTDYTNTMKDYAEKMANLAHLTDDFALEYENWSEKMITVETDLDAIVNLMDDDIREKVHFEMAPCTEESFLKRYLQLDPDFENVLQTEFGIEMEEENVRL